MNKSELTRKVSRRVQLPIPAVESVLAHLLEVLTRSLASGEAVTIKNFGRFERRERAMTTRRNPRTGEVVKVPERSVVVFRPAPALTKRVN